MQNLHQQLPNLRIDVNILLRLLAHLKRKVKQTVLDLLIPLSIQSTPHLLQTVEKLQQPQQTTNYLNLQKVLLIGFIRLNVIVYLRYLRYRKHQTLNLQRHLQILLLNLHEHLRQLDLVLNLPLRHKTKSTHHYYSAYKYAYNANRV